MRERERRAINERNRGKKRKDGEGMCAEADACGFTRFSLFVA